MNIVDENILNEAVQIIIHYSNDIVVLKEQKKIINRVLNDNIRFLDVMPKENNK